MRLVAEVRSATALAMGPARVGIERGPLPRRALGVARRGDAGLDQRRVDERAALDHQPAPLELAVDLGEHLRAEPAFDQLAAIAAERRMVRHFLFQAQPHEAPKAQPIAYRLFQLR